MMKIFTQTFAFVTFQAITIFPSQIDMVQMRLHTEMKLGAYQWRMLFLNSNGKCSISIAFQNMLV